MLTLLLPQLLASAGCTKSAAEEELLPCPATGQRCRQAAQAKTSTDPAAPRAQSNSKHPNPAHEYSTHVDVVLHVPVQNLVNGEQVLAPVKRPPGRPLLILRHLLDDLLAH